MNESSHMAPLAAHQGRKPPAPDWFERALAETPERSFIEVEGARIETLAWGERGRPGLILLHGGAAHADWWSFIAPFFARERRVVAPSFAGMGRSDWRPHYEFKHFVREAREAGRTAGAFDAGPPVVIGHSFGGRIAVGMAHEFGHEIAAAVMVDPPFFAPRNPRPPSPPRPAKAHRLQPSLEAVVSRFRLAPPQACDNLYILDHIARASAREVADHEGERGWAWRFDPHMWERSTRTDLTPFVKAARSPLALIRGGRSRLFHAEDAAYLLKLMAPGAPYIEIPEAEHHVMIDQPLAFVAAVRALIAAWPPAKGA